MTDPSAPLRSSKEVPSPALRAALGRMADARAASAHHGEWVIGGMLGALLLAIGVELVIDPPNVITWVRLSLAWTTVLVGVVYPIVIYPILNHPAITKKLSSVMPQRRVPLPGTDVLLDVLGWKSSQPVDETMAWVAAGGEPRLQPATLRHAALAATGGDTVAADLLHWAILAVAVDRSRQHRYAEDNQPGLPGAPSMAPAQPDPPPPVCRHGLDAALRSMTY